jgi:hypothetical protein
VISVVVLTFSIHTTSISTATIITAIVDYHKLYTGLCFWSAIRFHNFHNKNISSLNFSVFSIYSTDSTQYTLNVWSRLFNRCYLKPKTKF